MNAAASGDDSSADQLLLLVYEELRALARARLARENPGQTLQATALVHEAYLRLVGPNPGGEISWESRAHFFGAAAEAMRRIIIDRARARGARKRGGNARRLRLDGARLVADGHSIPEIIDLDDALTRFEVHDPQKAMLVKLRFFGGLTLRQAAEALGLAPTTADRHWVYARAWLFNDMSSDRLD